jgi:TolA-binding protein
MSTGYGKAREYLQKVISQFPSTEAQKTLERIKLIEKEVNR